MKDDRHGTPDRVSRVGNELAEEGLGHDPERQVCHLGRDIHWLLEVDLEPGTYVVYCPVDDHREEGMELELTVNEE